MFIRVYFLDCFLFIFHLFFFFFFQAEDGIRDWSVTGVQTCALPICSCSHKGLVKLETAGPAREGSFLSIWTSSPGSATGKSRSITVSIKPKMAVLAPMPRASERTATAVTRGVRLRIRSA